MSLSGKENRTRVIEKARKGLLALKTMANDRITQIKINDSFPRISRVWFSIFDPIRSIVKEAWCDPE